MTRRAAPTLVAAVPALAYVLISPPSADLAAHLLRAKLFGAEGFGLWSNWWYAGHNVVGYSVLFPALAWLLTPQVVAAVSAVASATVFEAMVHDEYGDDGWLGSVWFGAATTVDLYTGRLTFAFGLLPALGTALALKRRRNGLAVGLAALTAVTSPVAALFAALVGAAKAGGRWSRGGLVTGGAVIAAALGPVLALAIAFPEGGREPFAFSALWPVLLITVVALASLPGDARELRAGIALYLIACIASYAIATPVGSNVARLATLAGGPLAALLWWRRRTAWLLIAVAPLLYLQWQAPVREVIVAADDPSTNAPYYAPLLSFLARQGGPPFRIEIPFTRVHWEAYEVAPRFPLVRGWERQLDIKYNGIFYDGLLSATSYDRWLHDHAVRFVAEPDAASDYSAVREESLIDHGLPYLREVFHSAHWHVYAVVAATPIVTGPARLLAIGPNSLTIVTTGPGRVLVNVRFSPYWKLSGAPGCVEPAGDVTALALRQAGPVRLITAFSLGRIGARTPRCS